MARYDNVEKIFNKGITNIGTSYLPKHEDKNSDILLIATQGDRCDLIAQEYYGTTELWWYVASVNNLSSNKLGDEPTPLNLLIICSLDISISKLFSKIH